MKTRMRPGIAVFVAITMFASLLVLYSSGSGSDSTMKRAQPQSTKVNVETLKTATEQQHESQPTVLPGYISITDHKPLMMHCRTCALVTSSGHLTGSLQGDRIDQSECVIRMNDAPTKDYGRDVGNKTNVRVIAHSSIQRILRNRSELLNGSQGTVFIFWGPSTYMRKDGKGHVYNNLRIMNQILPHLKVYIITRHKMIQADELFRRETGKDRKVSNTWLSTGWFTMLTALELCDRINIYGMVSPSFCREPNHTSVPYHYYEPSGPDECTMYISHEYGKKGSHHRFITEKQVFANWARTFNIHFYQPEWKPDLQPTNNTGINSKL
ncbi:alpha-N-acetylgalactosaminide alpha-2,6-sialyltransferase 5 [Protopterus annectens]|uniref:alpha-N-acetylgalactosaminide alpha-2,6-sialyltransferase 5 n=1 Tax=Protopterus annectens TaxID=7888 RepID=UPI001CF962AF|nr:alpha-N-acetylgalactosaminide alpha-2,6-sialyltransferase 5 [Protopterus annectens]